MKRIRKHTFSLGSLWRALIEALERGTIAAPVLRPIPVRVERPNQTRRSR